MTFHPAIPATLCVLLCAAAHAQSVEDKRTSLVGLERIAFKENGVARLGGGTAGSPYLLQFGQPFAAAGGTLVDFDGAIDKGLPVYELVCTSMDWSDGSVRVACESHLLRPVLLSADAAAHPIYASTWTSRLLIASFPDQEAAQFGTDKMTAQLVEQFISDWSAANPKLKPVKPPGKGAARAPAGQ